MNEEDKEVTYEDLTELCKEMNEAESVRKTRELLNPKLRNRPTLVTDPRVNRIGITKHE